MVTSLNLVLALWASSPWGMRGLFRSALVPPLYPARWQAKGFLDLGLFLIALLVGGLAAGIMGVLVGIPALRLRGDYLVTMAFAEIIRVCLQLFHHRRR